MQVLEVAFASGEKFQGKAMVALAVRSHVCPFADVSAIIRAFLRATGSGSMLWGGRDKMHG